MTELTRSLTLPCGLRVADRIAMAPLTNTQSNPDGTLHDDELRWLARRAREGFKWISTCATFVSEEGHAWPGQLGIASDAHLPGLTRLAKALTDAGATAVVQLHHGGAKADLAPETKLSTGGPKGCRAADSSDIERVIQDFVNAAQRAESAGFHGVEIHGANGYLFTQFLAPADNPRTDGYGGDLAGRARFLRQAMRAVRAAVSKTFAVGVRISPVNVWAERGLVVEDSAKLAQWLCEDGADFIHLSLSDAGGPPPKMADQEPVATTIRKAMPAQVPIFAAGGIWNHQDARRAMAAGVDVVVVGKAAIGNPDWAARVHDPTWEPIRPIWSQDHLRSVNVGDDLLGYLLNFPGMVEGGKTART